MKLICPLNDQALKDPIENLSAEEARKCVKVFDSLPYSPADAATAREVATLISEHARLGFGEVKYDTALPEKLVETLRNKGFKIFHRWFHYPDYSYCSSIREVTERVTAFIIIQWGDDLPGESAYEKDTFSTHAECLAHAKEVEQKRQEKYDKEKAEKEAEQYKIDELADCIPATRGDGCLKLVLLSLLAVVVFAFCWLLSTLP